MHYHVSGDGARELVMHNVVAKRDIDGGGKTGRKEVGGELGRRWEKFVRGTGSQLN